MLRRQNRPCCCGCSPDPKGLLSPNHFGLRVGSGFDDGGEEQRIAERESRLAELDVVDKDGMRTRCVDGSLRVRQLTPGGRGDTQLA
jgi:hypothetical protein